jgi:hypothetical protein
MAPRLLRRKMEVRAMKPFVLMVSGLAAMAAFVRDAAAQATPPPAPVPSAAPSGDNSGVLIALALMGALLVIVGIGVKIWDAKRKREAEAVHLQSQLSDALLREADFFGLAITPTVHAGLRKGAPMTIDVTGQAPSEMVRDAALRIIREEASRVTSNFEIVDKIEVRPDAVRRVA